ncbi:MAG TPA: penicillin acylase family protein [Pyrinomonadaceae bacterium]|nr:penicillin acylase family protein [Pyrinomonadaceae bacterium]
MKKHCILLCLILSLTLASGWGPQPSGRAAAQQTSAADESRQTSITLQGLRDRVVVRRDGRGIPYIEASNEADLYFAQGYATASDRMWQMDLMRRTARGELAEIFGRDALEQDKIHRTYNFLQVVEAEFAQTPAHERDMLEAYARGVNALIDSLDPRSLPPEFRILQYRPRPWTPADSLLIGKLFFEVLTDNWQTDLMRAALAALPAEKREGLLVETSPLDVLVVGTDGAKVRSSRALVRPPRFSAHSLAALREVARQRAIQNRALERLGLTDAHRLASNNWVVSGKRTASGKPLLANDPHLPASAPSIWYMTHLGAPGVRVAGVTAPGLPGIVIGHNGSIAWGFTNVGPDVSDLYMERFDKANPRRYMTPDGWREATVRREEIKVRKSFTSTETEIVPLDVTATRHGPIVFEKDSVRYALRWTALDPQLQSIRSFYALNRARNWKEFSEALSDYSGPMQNMVYADEQGHIGYYAAGRVPQRKAGDGSTPYDGATAEGEWTGYIPFDQLPHLLDPPSGMIVTANQRIVGSSYPFFLTHNWASPYRAHRIRELLEAKQKLTAEDFRAIQGDTYSIGAALLAREVVKAGRERAPAEGEARWRETLKLLEGWDGYVNADSRAALLANVIRNAFRRRILEAALGPELAETYDWNNSNTLIDRILRERPSAWLPKDFKSYAELLKACEAEARSTIEKRLGANEAEWTWGRYTQANFPHPLARAPLIGLQFAVPPFPQNGAGGNNQTVNVGRFVSMRLIADPSDWDKTQQGIALGQSGNPSSPHWIDQLADWRAVTPQVFPFTVAATARATRETLLLIPAK